MLRSPAFGILLCVAVGMQACALPHGSLARPVEAIGTADSGGAPPKNRLTIGGLVPFAVVGAAFDGDDDTSFSGLADGFVLVPAAAYDYAFEPRQALGLGISLISTFVSEAGTSDSFGIFFNPRYETDLSDYLSFTVDGNVGYFSDGDDGAWFFTPTVGLRGYLPTGFGGFIISQQLGTGIITLTTPGSLAYDVPIPLGETSRLHLFPEIRWDPTFVFIDSGSGAIALFSAGISFMVEL